MAVPRKSTPGQGPCPVVASRLFVRSHRTSERRTMESNGSDRRLGGSSVRPRHSMRRPRPSRTKISGNEAIRAFRARWIETVPHAIDGTVDILTKLKAGKIPLYAITNFASDTLVEAKERYPFLATSFIDMVVSADEKLLKPDPAIYQVLLNRQNLQAEDCVFVDDSLKNVKAASKLGFHALLFTTPEAFAKDLRTLGFSF